MAFGVTVVLSLSWFHLVVSRYIQNLSNVFNIGPLAVVCSISMHSSIGLSGCLFSKRWFA